MCFSVSFPVSLDDFFYVGRIFRKYSYAEGVFQDNDYAENARITKKQGQQGKNERRFVEIANI